MTSAIYVPRDSSTVSLGADDVARAIAAEGARRGASIRLVRNGAMTDGSLCALGGLTPFPALSALDYFPEDFGLEQAA